MRRPSVPAIWEAKHPEGLPQIVVGSVTSAASGGEYATIRVGSGAGRVVRASVVAEGLKLQTDDRVIVAHIGDSPNWAIIARVLDTKDFGLTAGKLLGEDELHPPNNLAVTGILGAVIAQWDAWAGNTICWEVQHNSSDTVIDAGLLYTRGSYYLYPSTTGGTRYVRVRAVRYDPDDNAAYFSRWSPWQSATAIVIGDVFSAGAPHFRIDGPLAAATATGGKWHFRTGDTLTAVVMCVKDTGTAGQTRIDLNLDGVSLWLLGSTKPHLMASETSRLCMEISNFDVSEIGAGGVLTLDIDEAATGVMDLDVFIHLS